jgi:hypothetical protein
MKYLKTQLNDRNFFNKIKDNVQEIIIHDMFLEAFRLARDLEKSLDENQDLADNFAELYSEYRLMVKKLKWVGLNILKEPDILDLFQNNFTLIYDIEFYDLWEKLKTVLISIIILEDRDHFKSSIKTALINNRERLTKNRIIINNVEKEPTVGNWLIDYNASLGLGIADKLKLSQYLVNSENIKKLDSSEKNKVKAMFGLYEKLKISSQTLGGVEEAIPMDEEYGKGWIIGGMPYYFKETEEEKELFDIASRVIAKRDNIIDDTTSESDNAGQTTARSRINLATNPELRSLLEISEQFPVGSLERRAIEEEIKKLSRQ